MQPAVELLPIRSVAEHHRLVGLPPPVHPLFSLYRFEEIPKFSADRRVRMVSDLYQIALKKDCPCKMKYGQTDYDFDEGLMSFFAPRQSTLLEPGDWTPDSGVVVLFHPDFLTATALQHRIKTCHFFGYAVDEALLLSGEEEETVTGILRQIEREVRSPADAHSGELVLAHLEALLLCCSRYYDRQFASRKPAGSSLAEAAGRMIDDFLERHAQAEGLLTVHDLASKLHLSQKYLSDCLKQLTGKTSQQLIHEKLVGKAKELLSTTELSVSEISYRLGFEFPQSFNKLFKNKTALTPLEFRGRFG